MPFTFTVTGYTNRARFLFGAEVQSSTAHLESEPAASFRRGFQLSIFNIFKTRAADVDQLQPEKQRLLGTNICQSYPKLQLPFVDQIDVPKWDAAQDMLSGARTCLIQTNEYLETAFRKFWDRIIDHFFSFKTFTFSDEFRLDRLHPNYPSYRSDFTVGITPNINNACRLLILVVELSRTQMYNEQLT